MKNLLHVGCGTGKLPDGYGHYREVRLDCDVTSSPDIVSSIVAMPMIEDSSYECVFASHVIEHLHFHEVAQAFAEFHRVLKEGGILEIFVPDLQAIGGRIAMDQLDDPVYICSMGPISPLDMIYGHRASIARGEKAMAHKTGFTGTVLKDCLRRAGFEKIVLDRDRGALELRAKAIKGASDASQERSPAEDAQRTLRTCVGQRASFRQQGKTPRSGKTEAEEEGEEEMKAMKAFGRKEPMNTTNTEHDHTGPTHHGNAHLGSVKGKDSVAHPSHHEMNKKHGAGAFNPPDEYEGGHEDGMDNEEHC